MEIISGLYCGKIRSTKASGASTEKGDVLNSVNLHIECKLRNTSSITIKNDVWQKLNQEIPLHSDKLPILALENKEGKRWVVLGLDDFINIYIEWYIMKFKNESGEQI